MYSRIGKGTAFLLFTMLSHVISAQGNAKEVLQQSTVLSAKPAMCVALNQGRTCFTKVFLRWKTTEKSDLCLYQKLPKQKIVCWNQTNQDNFSFEFESNESMTYQLLNAQNDVLAETKVDVSWVHKKSPRRRRWRLF